VASPSRTQAAGRTGRALSWSRSAWGALAQLDVRQRARPYLERVAALTGETTSLQILDGTQARFVDSVESVNAVRVGSRAGVSLPAHIASGGKAMLACMSDRALLTL